MSCRICCSICQQIENHDKVRDILEKENYFVRRFPGFAHSAFWKSNIKAKARYSRLVIFCWFMVKGLICKDKGVILISLNQQGSVRSMQWQLGSCGTVSAFVKVFFGLCPSSIFQ
jgi:hypothetical protein